jgi:hypothetical protein
MGTNFNVSALHSQINPAGLLRVEEEHQDSQEIVDKKVVDQKSEMPLCRVCLCEEENPDEDPLLTPCSCAGSMQYIHH